MENRSHRAIAVVGMGAILPDAPDVATFWSNVRNGVYSIGDVPPDRWDPALYFDPDPRAPDKTYSKIGGWVREFEWNPLAWHLPVPPRVAAAMDDGQKWAVACTRQALADLGKGEAALDRERTAVILGNAMAGEKHYATALRILYPEVARALQEAPSFAALPEDLRAAVIGEARTALGARLPEITEDTMPGELANCIAGRVANLFDFHGPNFVVDAACASAMAAISAAMEGLVEGEFDAALAGGIDRNMGVNAYVKFCKIGALSATGTRPYAEGADGFVMGEGAAIFVLKRLADAERAGDRIYAVLRGVGGASDGKGKGITAPNPAGQRLAVQRAWLDAGLSPAVVGMVEGHGTSTRVGDVVEVQSLTDAFAGVDLPVGSVALGSVKSNIGHLKGAAGAAGLLKAILALHHKEIPPSLHFTRPNPGIDFSSSPFRVNAELREWKAPARGAVRTAGVSAFGFGGTNFHAVLEEFVPGRLGGTGERPARVGWTSAVAARPGPNDASAAPVQLPRRGALVLGAPTVAALAERLAAVQRDSEAGHAPEIALPTEADLRSAERLVIDYGDARELAERAAKAARALAGGNPATWKVLRAQGIFRGSGPAAKVAFLYPGQGSQYVGMLAGLRRAEPIVDSTFREADAVMEPLLGRTLSSYVFIDTGDPAAVAQAEEDLRQTAITQPAVLAADLALTRLLEAYGVVPDMVMGHSLGEYGALVAAGALPFAHALEAVSARGREMTRVSVADNGWMAAVFAPLHEVERVLRVVDGYVVLANVNSRSQAVIGGASEAVERAMVAFQQHGYSAVRLPVSHAFHTEIVAPASEPLARVLERLDLRVPQCPTVANVTGEFYPSDPGAHAEVLDLLARQVASPVQFVKGLETLYDAGARVFVEVGPKRALQGFVDDVLGERGDVVALFTNHPKAEDSTAVNQALCGLYAAGVGRPAARAAVPEVVGEQSAAAREEAHPLVDPVARGLPSGAVPVIAADRYSELGRLFAEFLERSARVLGSDVTAREPVVITGAALGLPGDGPAFADGNVARILGGEQFIDLIPTRFRQAMLDKHITRLVKNEESGASFEPIESASEVIKLAARSGHFDLGAEYGVAAERLAAFDVDTRLAVAVGLDALRDAGIPLVLHYRTTSRGTRLPEAWRLPEELRDDTGVIFASAFPGYDAFAEDLGRYHVDRARRDRLALLTELRSRARDGDLASELDRRIAAERAELEASPYVFDRRFLFRILSMGHAQLAELIGARGPNTQVNSACASTTQAIAIAEDWIRQGRCRRVLIVAADDVTSENLLEWIGAGFLASGAAATDDDVTQAALPFDLRRHGMILGMGAAGLVVESAAAARDRGLAPIVELLGAVTANSAFHGTRLDVDHIGQVMERLVSEVERNAGVSRAAIAEKLLFVSHETYTPARGGSAAAEVNALRRVFGAAADRIVVANTKGFTGHPMGAGVEDVVAVKSLETGVVPPVANFRDVDPELGRLNLSRGGSYPVEYALRLGAGFGSQISMALFRWTPPSDGRHRSPTELGHAYRVIDPARWAEFLARVSGQTAPELEVVSRTLRVKDPGAGVRRPEVGPSPAPVLPSPAGPAPTASAAASVAVQPSAAALAAAGPGGGAAEDPVRVKVLEVVAAKTGYPADMLDADLDLEADLGIDTVKQAETFAAIRAAYEIPRDEKLRLRDFPTLAHVVRFVYDHRPDLAAAAAARSAATAAQTSAPAPAPGGGVAEDPVRAKVLEVVAAKTGYPADMLDADLDLEADLGIDTVKQAETFAAIRAAYDIPRDEKLRLRDFPTLAHVVRFVYDHRPDLAAAAARAAAPAVTSAVPAATTAQTSAPAPVPVGGAAEDPVRAKVLEVVAAKTGYPADMLDADLDLEADLGIDTVKQAETFAAIRAAYEIPRDEKLRLRDFPTLAHVVRFVYDHRPDLAAAAAGPTQAAAVSATGQAPSELASSRSAERAPETIADAAAAARIPRRGPATVLRPALDLCKPTGVRLGAGSRVAVLNDAGGVARALTKRLEKLGAQVVALDAGLDATALEQRLRAAMAEGPIHGVYWLAAADVEPDLDAATPEGWREALRVRVKLLYTAMRTLGEGFGAAGTFLVAATRLGGHHGYEPGGATGPLGGAVVGFVKAYGRENPSALVKAVDFAAERKPAEVATLLIEETLQDPGAVEVGYRGANRSAVALVELPLDDAQPGCALTADTVFLVTGAAGSIVGEIIADLAAAAGGGTFHLLDLVPEPDPSDADLARFAGDREGLKRELFERAKARGERATPATVERDLARLERAHCALMAMRAIREAGGTAYYESLDLRDGGAVSQAIERVRQRSGRIDVLLHAAGLEVSHFLTDKQPAEFDLVFDVKAEGWLHLLHATRGLPLGAVVAFSSIAGRFGNAGQTDYSAANDLLCKTISALRRLRPETRGLALDWTAWSGVGMAARGSIPAMMERAGIDMLPPAAGVAILRREIVHGSRGELVVAGRLGVLTQERDASGGLDVARLDVAGCGPMIGRVVGMPLGEGLVVEAELDPVGQAFLDDHRIEGTPVLPGVMGIEAFAEAATLLMPGRAVLGVEDVAFQAPFKFYRDDPRIVRVTSVLREAGEEATADCALVGTRTLAGQSEAQTTRHFVGRVRLGRASRARERIPFTPPTDQPRLGPSLIYRVYFHGPAYRVVDGIWFDDGRTVGRLALGLPPHHSPESAPLLAAPRLVELCFQTAGMRDVFDSGRLGLPLHVDSVVYPAGQRATGRLYAVITRAGDRGVDADVCDEAGTVHVRLRGYRTIALPTEVDADLLEEIRANPS